MLEAGLRPGRGQDFHLVFSPERVLTGRVFADLRKYPKLVGGLSEAGAAKAVEFYEEVLDFDDRARPRRGNGVWDLGSRRGRRAGQAGRDHLPRRQHRAGQPVRAASPPQTGIDVYQVIEASNSQPYSHIHQPGIAVGGHCIPVYPRLYLWNDPEATVVRAARAANAGDAGLHRRPAGGRRTATWPARASLVLGAAYRGGVKETAFSGVFGAVEALRRAGRHRRRARPAVHRRELTALGFDAYHLGEPVDAAVVQADHAEYRSWRPADLPGVKVFIDGRRVSSAERVAGRAPTASSARPRHRRPEPTTRRSRRTRCVIATRADVADARRLGDGTKSGTWRRCARTPSWARTASWAAAPTSAPACRSATTASSRTTRWSTSRPAGHGVFIGPAVVLTNDTYPRAVSPDGIAEERATTGPRWA